MGDILLLYLTLPVLQRLSLTLPIGHATPMPAIEGLLQRSECQLKALSLKGSRIDEEEIHVFLARNKSITDFEHDANNPGSPE